MLGDLRVEELNAAAEVRSAISQFSNLNDRLESVSAQAVGVGKSIGEVRALLAWRGRRKVEVFFGATI
jgi:hypothetical protein